MTKSSTEEILDMIRRDDRAVWGIIYRQHGRMLRTFVLKNSGNKEDANDQVQETMAAAYAKMRKPEFKLTCALGTYLYSIIRFKWLAELKRRGSTSTMVFDNEEFEIEGGVSEIDALEKESKFKVVTNNLLKLSEQCQKIVGMFYKLGKKSMEEIAVELGYANSRSAITKKTKCIRALKENCLIEYNVLQL